MAIPFSWYVRMEHGSDPALIAVLDVVIFWAVTAMVDVDITLRETRDPELWGCIKRYILDSRSLQNYQLFVS